MTEFTVKEVTVFTVTTFLNEALKEIFNINNRANLDCQISFTKEIKVSITQISTSTITPFKFI